MSDDLLALRAWFEAGLYTAREIEEKMDKDHIDAPVLRDLLRAICDYIDGELSDDYDDSNSDVCDCDDCKTFLAKKCHSPLIPPYSSFHRVLNALIAQGDVTI